MSRTIAGGLVTHLATPTHTRAGMLRLDLVDGSTIAVTDHDRTLSFDLGDGSADYTPRTGLRPSDVSLNVGFEPSEMEVTGPLVETATEAWHITKTMVLGGRLDDATTRYFQVNWRSLGSGDIKVLKGKVVLAEVIGGEFKLTVHNVTWPEIGRTITGYCDADFGDARCGYSVPVVEATVTAVTSERQFTVSFSGTYGDDFFNKGTVTFTSGALAGTRAVEIFDFQGGTDAGVLALWGDLAQVPEAGDTLDLRQGCGKTRGDCMAYDNIVNFRGFPDVPGTDQVLRYPNPGG